MLLEDEVRKIAEGHLRKMNRWPASYQVNLVSEKPPVIKVPPGLSQQKREAYIVKEVLRQENKPSYYNITYTFLEDKFGVY